MSLANKQLAVEAERMISSGEFGRNKGFRM
jgi:hypothetical protein